MQSLYRKWKKLFENYDLAGIVQEAQAGGSWQGVPRSEHVDEQKGKTKLPEDQASHLKIYNEQGEAAKNRLVEHERMAAQCQTMVSCIQARMDRDKVYEEDMV